MTWKVDALLAEPTTTPIEVLPITTTTTSESTIGLPTTTTTTGGMEIKDYDKLVNSDEEKYKISLINNRKEDLEVFFDGVPQEVIPRCSEYDKGELGSYLELCSVGTCKDYYVDRLLYSPETFDFIYP